VGISSNVGLGSGLNINEIVGQLVASERAGPSLLINRRAARANAQISALGTLRGAFSQLNSALAALKNPALFDTRSISSSDATRLSVRATGTTPAALGKVEIEIETLAEGQKLRSSAAAAVADADAAIGTGTLRFTADGTSFDVEIGADNNSLRGLANSINAQAGGKGVQASLVLGDDGYQLVLSAVKTGSAGTIAVEQVDGSNLAAFTSAEMDVVTAATDAVFYVDGVKRTSSTNVIADAVQGLELTLRRAELSEKVTLSVAQDSGGARQAIQNFVSAYNNAIGAIAQVTAYNPETNVAAALNGDSMVRGAAQQLRREMGGVLTELASSGLDLGLDTELDGKLKFDTAKFNAAYGSAPGQVEALFRGESGAIFSRLGPTVAALHADDGNFARRNDSLKNILKQADVAREALDRRMIQVEERYRARFIALDTLLGQLNNTSQYLAQQLSNLPKIQQ
jgi:flagellar hook-associated protein 2